MKRKSRTWVVLAQALAALLALGTASPAFAKKKAKTTVTATPAAAANVNDADLAESDSGDAFSDPGAAPGRYQLRTLLQTRFQHTAPDMAPIEERLLAEGDPSVAAYRQNLILERARADDGLGVQRAFLRVSAQPTRAFGAKLLVDFAELLHKNQKGALKLAYGELRATRAITVTAGLFKIPFSLLELLPIADYELADVGPTDALIKDLGVGGRDIGVKVEISPLRKRKTLSFEIAAFDGDNHNLQRHPGPGIVALRVKVRPLSHLEVGGDCVYRPTAVRDTDDSDNAFEKHASGGACSLDAVFSYHRFAVRGEWMTGKRTDTPLLPKDAKDHRFSALWALASYRMRLRDAWVLMPALRVEWLDEDQPSNIGQTFLVSGGINLDVSSTTRLLLDLSRAHVQGGTRDRSDNLGGALYRPSTTTGVVQLQFKL